MGPVSASNFLLPSNKSRTTNVARVNVLREYQMAIYIHIQVTTQVLSGGKMAQLPIPNNSTDLLQNAGSTYSININLEH